jgi:hypothetical protein
MGALVLLRADAGQPRFAEKRASERIESRWASLGSQQVVIAASGRADDSSTGITEIEIEVVARNKNVDLVEVAVQFRAGARA